LASVIPEGEFMNSINTNAPNPNTTKNPILFRGLILSTNLPAESITQQSKVLGDDGKEKGRRRMACLKHTRV